MCTALAPSPSPTTATAAEEKGKKKGVSFADSKDKDESKSAVTAADAISYALPWSHVGICIEQALRTLETVLFSPLPPLTDSDRQSDAYSQHMIAVSGVLHFLASYFAAVARMPQFDADHARAQCERLFRRFFAGFASSPLLSRHLADVIACASAAAASDAAKDTDQDAKLTPATTTTAGAETETASFIPIISFLPIPPFRTPLSLSAHHDLLLGFTRWLSSLLGLSLHVHSDVISSALLAPETQKSAQTLTLTSLLRAHLALTAGGGLWSSEAILDAIGGSTGRGEAAVAESEVRCFVRLRVFAPCARSCCCALSYRRLLIG